MINLKKTHSVSFQMLLLVKKLANVIFFLFNVSNDFCFIIVNFYAMETFTMFYNITD